ncbi:hypothetical protein pdam_00002116, partial [Pocillopora damicornis]
FDPDNLTIKQLLAFCAIFAKEMSFRNTLVTDAFWMKCSRAALTTNQSASNGAHKTPVHIDMSVVRFVFLTAVLGDTSKFVPKAAASPLTFGGVLAPALYMFYAKCDVFE